MHVTCSPFPFSSAFSLAPILLTMQYDHIKCTLDYILVIADLETVEVVYISALQQGFRGTLGFRGTYGGVP